LRERREDIGLFVSRALARVDPGARLSPEAGRRLLLAPWPLNVRELDNTVVVAALRAKDRPIAVTDLDNVPAVAPPPVPAQLSADDAELRGRLVAALAEHRGNISAVARELGRDRKQIHRWIARFAIDVPR
jgi:transcriptional regulator of acetoin/glycerol metabolism